MSCQEINPVVGGPCTGLKDMKSEEDVGATLYKVLSTYTHWILPLSETIQIDEMGHFILQMCV